MAYQVVIAFNYYCEEPNPLGLKEKLGIRDVLEYSVNLSTWNETNIEAELKKIRQQLEEDIGTLQDGHPNDTIEKIYFTHYIDANQLNDNWLRWYAKIMRFFIEALGANPDDHLHLTFLHFKPGMIEEKDLPEVRDAWKRFYTSNPEENEFILYASHIQFLLFERRMDRISIRMQRTAITRLLEVLLYQPDKVPVPELSKDLCLISIREYNDLKHQALSEEREQLIEWLNEKDERYFAHTVMQQLPKSVIEEYLRRRTEILSWESLYPISVEKYQREGSWFSRRYVLKSEGRTNLIKREVTEYRKSYIRQQKESAEKEQWIKGLCDHLKYREASEVARLNEAGILLDRIQKEISYYGDFSELSETERMEFARLFEEWLQSFLEIADLKNRKREKSFRLEDINAQELFTGIDDCIKNIIEKTQYSRPGVITNVASIWEKRFVSKDIYETMRNNNQNADELIEFDQLEDGAIFCLKIGIAIKDVENKIGNNTIDQSFQEIFSL